MNSNDEAKILDYLSSHYEYYTEIEENFYSVKSREMIGFGSDGKIYIIPENYELIITDPSNPNIRVGGATIKYVNNVICYFEEFYIEEAYRNLGYGKKILSYAIDHGLEYIMCLADNYIALNLYKKFGFKVIYTDPLKSYYILERKGYK